MSRRADLDIEWIGPDAALPLADAAAPPADAPMRRARRAAVMAMVVGLGVVVVVLAIGGGREPQAGTQEISPAVTIASGASQPWVALHTVDGSTRDGWPRPMIARGPDICFGFENFGVAPARPSLARCADLAGASPDHDQLVSLMTIRSGLDVWHVLMMGAPVDSVELRTAAGGVIDGARIHIDDDIVALRLPTADAVMTMSWRSGGVVTMCDAPADAVATGRFCPGRHTN